MRARKREPSFRLPEQRHWLKIFIIGLILSGYGSLEFLAVRPEIPNIFNDPVFASYWVLAGLFALFVAIVVRTWGSR